MTPPVLGTEAVPEMLAREPASLPEPRNLPPWFPSADGTMTAATMNATAKGKPGRWRASLDSEPRIGEPPAALL